MKGQEKLYFSLFEILYPSTVSSFGANFKLFEMLKNYVFWVLLTRSYITKIIDSRFRKSMFFCVRKLCFKKRFNWGLGSENCLEDGA